MDRRYVYEGRPLKIYVDSREPVPPPGAAAGAAARSLPRGPRRRLGMGAMVVWKVRRGAR